MLLTASGLCPVTGKQKIENMTALNNDAEKRFSNLTVVNSHKEKPDKLSHC